MKKITLMVVACLCLAACVTQNRRGTFAKITLSPNYSKQKHYKIAVMPFRNSNGTVDLTATDKWTAKLMGLGFLVVDRTQLEGIFEELKLNMSGAVSTKDLKSVGKLAGVDILSVGTINYNYVPEQSRSTPVINIFSGQYYGQRNNSSGAYYALDSVSTRFIDVETGEVLLTSLCCDQEDYSRIDDGGILTEMANAVKLNISTAPAAPQTHGKIIFFPKSSDYE